jgi:hypothetical protein
LITKVVSETGLVSTQSFGFDVEANKQIAPTEVVAPGAGTVRGDTPQAQEFFLKIDDFNGGSQDDKHKGEFDVDYYQFSVGLDATGQVVVSPLTVELSSGLGSALSQYAATQQPISSLRLVGRTVGGAQQEVYDLRLSGVTIDGTFDSNFSDQVTFDFERLSLTTKPQNPDGSLGAAFTFVYDVEARRQLESGLVTLSSDGGGVGASLLPYLSSNMLLTSPGN